MKSMWDYQNKKKFNDNNWSITLAGLGACVDKNTDFIQTVISRIIFCSFPIVTRLKLDNNIIRPTRQRKIIMFAIMPSTWEKILSKYIFEAGKKEEERLSTF